MPKVNYYPFNFLDFLNKTIGEKLQKNRVNPVSQIKILEKKEEYFYLNIHKLCNIIGRSQISQTAFEAIEKIFSSHRKQTPAEAINYIRHKIFLYREPLSEEKMKLCIDQFFCEK